MITLTHQLDMVPGAAPLQIDLSQYDDDFTLVFNLYARTGTLTFPSGVTAEIRGTKKDHTVYTASANISGNTVTVTGNQQMTAMAGKAVFELSVKKSGKELNSANFILNIEKAAADKDSVSSESVIRELIDVIDRTDELIAAAEGIDQYVTQAQAAAEDAEEAAQAAEAAAASMTDAHVGELIADYMAHHPYSETDPSVPNWAKQANKPNYTAAEVGALPDNTAIPSKTSDLTNDAGFLTLATLPIYSGRVTP